MQRPLVTIYITNYNYGQYIREAIESVINQTLKNIELIIIDDGSTDDSKEIIEEYKNLEFVSIIYQKNKGLNITNNIALRASKGKYIIRLDADDYFVLNALEILSDELEKDEELGLVFPDYYLIDHSGELIGKEVRHNFEKDVTLLDQAAHGACTMIRADYLSNLGGYNENYNCQDGYELWVKFTTHYKVKNVNTPLFYYRQHGKNLTSNENRILDTRANINKDYIKELNQEVNSIAIIPIRGGEKSIAFQKINNENLLDLKVKQALSSENITDIIISSPDESVEKYFNLNYSANSKLHFIKRSQESSRINRDLSDTVNQVLDNLPPTINQPKAVVLLAVEYPFVKSSKIDDAIHTMFLFNSDSLISVRIESGMIYQHKGKGMESVLNRDQFTKLEREALYKLTGGITVSKIETIKEHNKMIAGKVGHIVVDQESAHAILSEFDLKVANYIHLQNEKQ